MAATSTSSSLPLVVVLLLLLAASAVVPATAAGGKQHIMHGDARMVIVVRRGSGTRTGGSGGGAAGGAPRANTNSRWRLVEDEVMAAEELVGAGQGSNSYVALDKEKTYCPTSSQCAGKPGGGGSYTRPCTYENHCPQ